jgi:hypothetical protein
MEILHIHMISAVKETSPSLAYWMSHAEIEDAEIDASPGPTLSAALYSRLIPILSGQAIAILQGIPDQNGLEVWRTLSKRFNPITPFKCMMLFRKIVSMKLKKGEDMQTSVAKWEMHINNLERDHGEKMSDKIKMALMVQMLPDDIQRTIIQHMDRMENYRQVKDKLIGLVQSSATLKDDDAMDVDNLADERWDEYECETNALGKGSGSGCFRCGGLGHQACQCATSKGKGKEKKGEAKGAFKGYAEKGKGKADFSTKGDGKGYIEKASPEWCAHSGKRGHQPDNCYTLRPELLTNRRCNAQSMEEEHVEEDVHVYGFEVGSLEVEAGDDERSMCTDHVRVQRLQREHIMR